MATTDFTNATLKLLIEDRDGIVTVASLQQVDLPPPIHAATITLTNTQIKALPTTPVVIVPATEVLNYSGFPSKLFFPVSAYGVLDTTAGAYTNDGTGNLVLLIGTDGYSTNFNVGIAASSTSYTTPIQCNPWSLSDLGFSLNAGKRFFSFIVGQLSTLDPGSVYDNALVMQIAGANPITGGNPANTLKVVIQYFELNVP